LEIGNEQYARRALTQARSMATTESERRAVSRSWRLWLREEPPGEFVPSGLTPSQLSPPVVDEFGWPRDAQSLFDWLRQQVADTMLESIAAADYDTESDKHHAALRQIRDEGQVPIPLPWHPREVLALRHWQEGLDVDHVERAFCCLVLCLAEFGDGECSAGGVEDALSVLLESCIELGPNATTRLPGLLSALAGQTELDAVSRLFTRLALLLVGVHLEANDVRLEPLAAGLSTDVERAAPDAPPTPQNGILLGLTFFDQRVSVWRRLVAEARAAVSHLPASSALVQLLTRVGTTS
jgi:hypothetical protein